MRLVVAVALCAAVAARADQAAVAPAGAPVSGDDAVALEEKAFAAIEAEKWCLAMRLFEAAHEKGPAVGLLTNAVQAAEFAGDFGSALGYADAVAGLARATKAEKAAAKKKANELAKRIAKAGAGTQCPTLDELAPKPAPAPTTTQTTTTTTTTQPPEPDAPPPVDARPFAFVGAGVGAGVALLGGATAAVGLVPWFAHADAGARIAEAEAQRADASGLQQEQAAAREGWESYGQALTVAGVVTSAVGLAVVAGGVGYGLFAPAPAEDAL